MRCDAASVQQATMHLYVIYADDTAQVGLESVAIPMGNGGIL